jgi:cobalt-precorrin 5A hydrolase/precorrin-3B C17-methyltransferase
MAALVFELLNDIASTTWARIEIIVEPGISAFQAAAARAGAPLGHDFCAISLSDLMTPWSVIEKRLQAAANADFVVALYNPASKKRRIGLKIATEIFSKARPSSCPVLIARELGRPNEKIIVTTLEKFKPETVDMLTIIIIGARNTRLYNNDRGSHMYTPRGYIEI